MSRYRIAMRRCFYTSLLIVFLTFQMFYPFFSKVYAAITTTFSANLTVDQSFKSPDLYYLEEIFKDSSKQFSGELFENETEDSYNFFAVNITPSISGEYEFLVTDALLSPPR